MRAIMQHKNRNTFFLKISSSRLSFYGVFAIFVLVTCYLLLVTPAQAAPQFLASWKADSYVPSWYQGKILPSRGTPVTVSFEVINSGQKADLSGTAVRWYINNKLVKNETNGFGIQSISFNIPDYGGQETEVRIAIPNYRGSELNHILRIPVKNPEAVLGDLTLDYKE